MIRRSLDLRAFTLLELAVAIAMSVVVIGAATAVLANVLVTSKRQRAHAELQRDAEFVGQLLTQDLRQAGLGVPAGFHVQDDGGSPPLHVYGTGSNGTVNDLLFAPRRILVATPTGLGMLGDLPRPDGNYAAFGPLHNRWTGAAQDTIAWHNENNGACVGNGCSTAASSIFFAGLAGATDCSAAGTDVTCPWSLRRVLAGDVIQIVDGRGNWSHSRSVGVGRVGNGVLGMRLNRLFDVSGSNWPNDADGTGPTGFIGQGWVTTLDRVFYRLTGTTIERNQCFGDPDPGDADWPTANAVPGNPQNINPPVSGGVSTSGASICTGYEVVARNVTSLNFGYFDISGNAAAVATAADRDTITRVEWTIVFENNNNVGATPVQYTLQGAVVLAN